MDSRCCTFTVVITVMPASSSSWMSCQRLALRAPGTFVCAISSTSTTSGRARQDRVDVHLGERRAAVDDRAARHDLQVAEHRLGVRAAVRLDIADDDVGAAVARRLALLEHPVRLADAGRGTEIDAQRADRHAPSLPALIGPGSCPLSGVTRQTGCTSWETTAPDLRRVRSRPT